MKCEDVSKELIAYLDRRASSADRAEMEGHLANCAACRTRAEEFRKVWGVLDELPLTEPSFAFDARVRQRVAAEPRHRWFGWFVPQPRLAFSVALLVVMCVWLARLPQANPIVAGSTTPQTEQEDFKAIKDLGVLENYDVLSKFDALSELPPVTAPDSGSGKPGQDQQDSGSGGVM